MGKAGGSVRTAKLFSALTLRSLRLCVKHRPLKPQRRRERRDAEQN